MSSAIERFDGHANKKITFLSSVDLLVPLCYTSCSFRIPPPISFEFLRLIQSFQYLLVGQIKPASLVKLIIGVITANTNLLDAVYLKLEDRFSEIDFASQLIPFDYTAYYEQEMGKGLQRQFISFDRLTSPDELAAAKCFSNTVEHDFAENETTRRRVNLDPGYISAAKLVLASTKDHAHRIHLQNGIYAENTLKFRNKTFQPWEWTYPDYRTPAYIEIFNYIRQIYLGQLKVKGLSAHPV